MYKTRLIGPRRSTASSELAGLRKGVLAGRVRRKVRLDSAGPHRHSPRARWDPALFPRPAASSMDLKQFLPAFRHLVERGDPQHPVLHQPARRAGRPRPVRQRLLPKAGHRSVARLRAALGDLQRRLRGLDDPAGLERLAASHRRRPAERGGLQAPPVGAAAYRQPDRHAGGDSAQGVDPQPRPAASRPPATTRPGARGRKPRLHSAAVDRQIGPA